MTTNHRPAFYQLQTHGKAVLILCEACLPVALRPESTGIQALDLNRYWVCDCCLYANVKEKKEGC